MTPVGSAEKEEIVELVRHYLEPYQPKNYRLEVVPDGVRQDDDWYDVVVQAVPDVARSYEYYGLLTEAEMKVQEEKGKKVLLVPVLPG